MRSWILVFLLIYSLLAIFFVFSNPLIFNSFNFSVKEVSYIVNPVAQFKLCRLMVFASISLLAANLNLPQHQRIYFWLWSLYFYFFLICFSCLSNLLVRLRGFMRLFIHNFCLIIDGDLSFKRIIAEVFWVFSLHRTYACFFFEYFSCVHLFFFIYYVVPINCSILYFCFYFYPSYC